MFGNDRELAHFIKLQHLRTTSHARRRFATKPRVTAGRDRAHAPLIRTSSSRDKYRLICEQSRVRFLNRTTAAVF